MKQLLIFVFSIQDTMLSVFLVLYVLMIYQYILTQELMELFDIVYKRIYVQGDSAVRSLKKFLSLCFLML